MRATYGFVLVLLLAVASNWAQARVGLYPYIICTDLTRPNHERIEQCTVLIDNSDEWPSFLPKAHAYRAVAYRERKDFALALTDFNRALELDPDFAGAFAERALLQSYEGRLDRALADLNRAIELDETADFYLLRGRVFRKAGKPESAISDLNAAIRKDNASHAAIVERGNVLAELGRYEQAISDYKTALVHQPHNLLALNGLCWSRAVLGRELQEALIDCDMAVRLGPGLAAFYDSRGLLMLKLGNAASATDDYASAVMLDKANPHHLYGRGLARLKLGDKGGSQDLAAARAQDSKLDELYASYGVRP